MFKSKNITLKYILEKGKELQEATVCRMKASFHELASEKERLVLKKSDRHWT